MNCGNRIRQLREEREWTQNDLAAHLQVDRTTISNWERGHRIPDLENFKALAHLFETGVDYLLCRDDEWQQMIDEAQSHGLSPSDMRLAISFVVTIRNQQSRDKTQLDKKARVPCEDTGLSDSKVFRNFADMLMEFGRVDLGYFLQ
jgi:transcriptional regulator with XRE-family HTH domain